MQTADITSMLEAGIKPETVKSGPLRHNPTQWNRFPGARCDRGGSWRPFRHIRGHGGDASGNRQPRYLRQHGRVYSGRQAHQVGLVDAIGGVVEARRWLEENHQINAGLPLRDLDVRR